MRESPKLAKNLGLEVAAEGIETKSQALALQALGCERGQGFYLGRPSPGVDRLSAGTLGNGSKSSIKRIAYYTEADIR